jgi:hypothetical protein
VDTAWIWAWLHFVHYDRDICPHPGPCRNDALLKYNSHTNMWSPRPGLVSTRKLVGGHYAKVSYEIWEVFREYYPTAGPVITVTSHKVLLVNCFIKDFINMIICVYE